MDEKWHSIIYELRNTREGISSLFTRDEIRSRVQFFAVYIIFFLVGLGMTVLNLITGWYGLAITTAIFSLVNLVNILCATANERLERFAEWAFAVEITALFTVFIINGEPEGFSAIWALIMPASGLILYGKKNGSIISAVLLAIIMVLFWTPFGRSLLLFDYTTSFLNRFPMIYIALFAVDFFFETVRHMTQKELTSTRNEFRFQASHDVLTGLMNRMGFNSRIDEFLDSDPDGFAFAIADLDFFKRINDTYGHSSGDIVLRDFANTANGIIGDRGFMCRWGGEEFAILIYDPDSAERLCEKIRRKIEQIVHTFDGKSCRHTVSFGISIVRNSRGIPISEIVKIADDNLYNSKETGRNKISCSEILPPDEAALCTDEHSGCTGAGEMSSHKAMSEKEIVSGFDEAMLNGDFYLCYQPQMNHSTGRMIGAEALARWNDPEFGTQYPSDFIPVLEANGLITAVSRFAMEEVCRFQHDRLQNNLHTVPISVNLSRHDIFEAGFVEKLDEIRKKYDVPVKYINFEITESAAGDNTENMKSFIDALHSRGYVVEMDDFGSGYSSLNVLREFEVDVIKMDLFFLKGEVGGRGGAIINAVVNMAKWLDTIVIAEGVETVEQADYLSSMGCNYIQGYLYSRPVRAAEFKKMLEEIEHEPKKAAMDLVDRSNDNKFWDPDSLENLVFSSFVGAAAVINLSVRTGDMELVRANKKYYRELGMNMTGDELITSDAWRHFDEENRKVFMAALEKAGRTEEEVVCETWRSIYSRCCGEDRICIRSTIKLIGTTDVQKTYYVMVQNITTEKKKYNELQASESLFRFAAEQINEYAWEYTVATKEMRPCYRCMRDLGLPPLVKNYPEPAIEQGIFPQDYADMYRDWHRQIAEGVEHLEAIIPLTVGRIPFHVRYTTEFDESGRPLKAYGSAALVVDNKE